MRSRVRRVDAAPREASAPKVSEGLAGFMDDPIKEAKIKGGRRLPPTTEIKLAMRSAEACAKSGDWSAADARTLLGLYAFCHASVYKIAPVELENIAEFRIASRVALQLLHSHFDDDASACAIFIRWSWKREKERAAWAAKNNKDRNRMGWRFQFSAKLVTDYLVARAAHVGKD